MQKEERETKRDDSFTEHSGTPKRKKKDRRISLWQFPNREYDDEDEEVGD